MGRLQSEKRRQIVEEDLKRLKEAQYLEENTYTEVLNAHNQYYADLENKKHASEQPDVEKDDKKEITPAKPKKVKKVLSQQEIRDRNITWSLILGVILLLIGGMVLATSTWDTLTDWKKTGLIGLVSLLFFGLAYVTTRVVKIEKTAFAFHVLGSLFLPIVIVSAGYFELFGPYFSFSGEGRFLYGAAGSLVILPVYLFLSIKLVSRLFVWFSYITFTFLAGFLIASMAMSADGFYLGIMAFNGALIIACSYLRKQGLFHLFTNEFVSFIQANLILSTLLMLVFYDNELIYSFNLMLTAIIYFAMIFVTNHKEYNVVFSAMLVYGAYQLIEFSALNEISAIAYALLGFVFVAVPNLIKDSSSLHKAFQYTSAIVSAAAFLFISFEGIIMHMNEPSVVLLTGYLIIFLNFTYLSNQVQRTLFTYLSTVFFTAALYEVVLIGRDWFGYSHLGLPMFITGFFLYVVFGCFMKLGFFQLIKKSARDVGGIVMVLCILLSIGITSWWQIGTMFLLLAVIALFMDHFEERPIFTDNTLASWLHAFATGLAVITYFMKGTFPYSTSFVDAGNVVLAGVIVLLVSLLWRQLKRDVFYENTFFAAQGFYAVGILMTFIEAYDANFRALIVLGGVGMAYLLYRKTKWPATPYVISGTALLFYVTALYALHTQVNVQSDLFQSLQFVIGSLLILGTGTIIGNTDHKLMKSFWVTGHLYMPFALIISLLSSGEEAVWAFLVAVSVYGISVIKTASDWLVNTFLYSAFTSFWIAVYLAMLLLTLNDFLHYSFMLTSGVLIAGWYISKGIWSRRIAYYVVPFSILGMWVFTSVHEFDLLLFVMTGLYGATLLYLMHQEKWDIFNAVPLLIIFQGLLLYNFSHLDWAYAMQVTVAGFVLIVLLVGMLCYRSIFQDRAEKELFRIDWYTIVGFMATCSLYVWTNEALWTQLLPGIMIVGMLLLQAKRIPQVASKWVVFVACVFLLQPYYTLMMNLDVEQLIEREVYVLPWVILAILVRKVADKSYKTLINNVQWATLIVVSLLLIQDGMASSTIYDALIVGTLALVSILGGMIYHIKSFFFVGAGVLLLNVFLQTRPYWGNLPWWMYLLVAGSILIAVASYYEWHKQKTSAGKDTLISVVNKKVIQRIKKWD